MEFSVLTTSVGLIYSPLNALGAASAPWIFAGCGNPTNSEKAHGGIPLYLISPVWLFGSLMTSCALRDQIKKNLYVGAIVVEAGQGTI